jgi:hypothetical protein
VPPDRARNQKLTLTAPTQVGVVDYDYDDD